MAAIQCGRATAKLDARRLMPLELALEIELALKLDARRLMPLELALELELHPKDIISQRPALLSARIAILPQAL